LTRLLFPGAPLGLLVTCQPSWPRPRVGCHNYSTTSTPHSPPRWSNNYDTKLYLSPIKLQSIQCPMLQSRQHFPVLRVHSRSPWSNQMCSLGHCCCRQMHPYSTMLLDTSPVVACPSRQILKSYLGQRHGGAVGACKVGDQPVQCGQRLNALSGSVAHWMAAWSAWLTRLVPRCPSLAPSPPHFADGTSTWPLLRSGAPPMILYCAISLLLYWQVACVGGEALPVKEPFETCDTEVMCLGIYSVGVY
jgi:hypothetical protein